MDDALLTKYESGSLDWTEEEMEQLQPWMREIVEQDLIEEVEHRKLICEQLLD